MTVAEQYARVMDKKRQKVESIRNEIMQKEHDRGNWLYEALIKTNSIAGEYLSGKITLFEYLKKEKARLRS